MKNEGRKGGKLDIQFLGPYVISEDLGKGRFRLKDEKGVVLKKSYNTQRLKLWLEPNVKSSLSKDSSPPTSHSPKANLVPHNTDLTSLVTPAHPIADSAAVTINSTTAPISVVDPTPCHHPINDSAASLSTTDTASLFNSPRGLIQFKEQLFDNSLLRLWRTGAMSFCVRGEEQDENHDYVSIKLTTACIILCSSTFINRCIYCYL